ncbi:hypothetical protein HK414_13005 [Ramlibacter terrae]|uniref:Uncharacterized protein n=1 Tax=Ramlibacter terrae TaxID=2732511 RepID=A0ABX6P4B3_9BURK|nr:hypothetical protein HK414_13005 [Ramlibacter terrae]
MIPNDTDADSITPEPASGFELQEQPGGRILVEAGVPFAANRLQAEIDAAYSRLWTFYAWIGPLAEAALSFGGTEGKAQAITEYGNDTTGQYSDREKHDAYLAHVRKATGDAQPWIWPMLDAARASVVVSPVGFCFTVSTRHGVQFDIAAMLPFCGLTPFAEGDEVAH